MGGEPVLYNNFNITFKAEEESHMFGSSKSDKKVTQEDLDMIRIKMEDIDSTEDKTFLLEKLYQYIRGIDSELKSFDPSSDSSEAEERKAELLRLKEDAQDIRKQIISRQLPSGHYGLFVQYPKGYEG